MTYVIIVNLVLWIFFLKQKENVVLWLPLIFVLISFVYPLLTDIREINMAYSRGATLLSYTEVFFIFIIAGYIIIKNYKYSKSWGVFPFILYGLLLLLLFASDKELSAKNLLKFSREFLLLPAAFIYFIKNPGSRKFYKMTIFLIIVATIYVIFSSVTELGYNMYVSSF